MGYSDQVKERESLSLSAITVSTSTIPAAEDQSTYSWDVRGLIIYPFLFHLLLAPSYG